MIRGWLQNKVILLHIKCLVYLLRNPHPKYRFDAMPLGGSSLLRIGLYWLPLKISRRLPLFVRRGLAGMLPGQLFQVEF